MSMTKVTLFYSLIAVLCLTSCVDPFASRDHLLPDEAYTVNPYAARTTLVFESNTNAVDTLFIEGITTVMGKGGDPFSIAPDSFEAYRINYSSTSMPRERGLVYVGWYDEAYDIRFEFKAAQAQLFCRCSYSALEFDKIPSTTMTIAGTVYTDVKILTADAGYEDRDLRVTKLFWSTSAGVLGWETPRSIWKLKDVLLP